MRGERTELSGLADAGRATSLDAEQIKRDLRARVVDVRTLLTENVQQGRAMLRKLLDGPIDCEAIREEGRRGFRFRRTLTVKRLISGEAATSLTGRTAAGSSRRPVRSSPAPTARSGRAARSEGFEEIADWFETLAKAERSHANRFQKALDQLSD